MPDAKAKAATKEQVSPPRNLRGTRKVQIGVGEKELKNQLKPGVKYKFPVVLQMVFGRQMQMRSLQLANLQLPCQKPCQQ